MRFDASFTPVRSGLPASLVASMDSAFYTRRAAGLNVQFIRETDSALDEFSFGDVARRDSFVAALARRGVPFALSA